ncbi:MAG: alpha/beta hydrolase [Phaeodactylibacter sp.]|nr:alpha/beta hydrolase [Phaeodactylibacter sp.]
MKTSSFEVSGGRVVAYNLYGEEAHFPVVFFHGMGGSRNSIAIDEGWLRQKQWSVVSFDRPGVGCSGALPSYTLEQVAADAAALIAHLGHKQCAAYGWSAGGAFAMAFAVGFPEMVDFLALAGTAVPAGDGKHRWWPADRMQWLAFTSCRLPLLARLCFRLAATRYSRNPESALERVVNRMSPSDRQLMQLPAVKALFRRASDDAWSRGGHGPFCDARAIGRRLSGCLDDVRMPVHLWSGEEDSVSPVGRAQKLSGHFSKATVHQVKAAGHLLYLQNIKQILEVSLW